MSKHGDLTLSEGLIISGYQKKLNTMKRKFFALYKETLSNVARLEYYDNEKKFKSGFAPKRVIELKACFNINRRHDTKYDYVIALSTKDGGLGIVLETEDEMCKWLELLITLQRSYSNFSNSLQPHFEHMWQVVMQKKGLAEDKGMIGNYHVGLTKTSLTFIRIGPEKTYGDLRKPNAEFLLTTIRRCGDSQCVFYMEVGRQSIIGPGELWMETKDALIAQNMHHLILSAMSAKGDSCIDPMRKRSLSANEASKPINVLQRRQTQSEHKTCNSPQTYSGFGRDRCDSLPSRNRTSSECNIQNSTMTSSLNGRNMGVPPLRLHSYQRNSPPITNIEGCSGGPESSISIDEPDDNGVLLAHRFNSRSSKAIIPEENTDELANTEQKCKEYTGTSKIEDQTEDNYVTMAPIKASKGLLEMSNLTCGNNFNPKDECKYVSSSIIYTSGSNKYFPEYSSDVSKVHLYPSDVSQQSELPTRTYSIGNKIEHIKKSFENSNEAEQSTVRERAFSVGSRAKIPRCDLQRDVAAYKHLKLNVGREKKSSSAPLLIDKCHSSVNHMSDLMEIDFSRSSSYIKTEVPEGNGQILKCTLNTNRSQIKKSGAVYSEMSLCKSAPLPNNLFGNIHSGYLEMKPVGNLMSGGISTYSSKKFVESECLLDSPNSLIFPGISHSNRNTTLSNTSSSTRNNGTMDNCKNELFEENINQIPNIPLIPSDPNYMHGKNIDIFNETILSSKYTQLSLKSIPKCDRKDMKDEYINVEKSLKENVCGDFKSQITKSSTKVSECKQQENNKTSCRNVNHKCNWYNLKKKIQNHESGYEILQIKSDSSLQTHKAYNQTPNLRIDKQLAQVRPKSSSNTTIISPPSSYPISTLCGCTSSSTSCLNYLPISYEHLTSKGLNTPSNSKNNVMSNSNQVQLQTSIVSRPPSVSSEHELYYAKLDLPKCTLEINANINKYDNSAQSAVGISKLNNSYAKIDFDHSDSSSSSSKNINN